MKKLLAILLSTIFTFSVMAAEELGKITPVETQKLMSENKAVVIDVREENEVKEGMIKGALFIPMSLMDKNKVEWEKEISKLPKDKTIVVYCRSGRRSGIVGGEILKKGYKVSNMGGFESWKAAGLPTENKK